ncbi:hypothetical protein GJ633_03630 [Halorubrum sp. CBA1125]|uniref:DUF5615 family PIN-like protein n=1 Tax=Halorubrum sp. CBA1125 TaxID=2668072 RepID=UPI0012E8B078|nr:DUF5615 family PIN-like protein [Halorubrum sp. CBA1125]MUW13855.1 hypothetical protein [Halorubrum sp. CBA1125]
MEYRILVDENTSPRVAESLRGKGYAAEHVHDVLEEGVDDETIAATAREQGYTVLTHDSDFLDPEKRGSIPVVYYGDDTMDTYEIADRVDELITWIPDPRDLPPVTNLSEWK